MFIVEAFPEKLVTPETVGWGGGPNPSASRMLARAVEATLGGLVFALEVYIFGPISFSAEGEGGNGSWGPWLGLLLTGSVCFGI